MFRFIKSSLIESGSCREIDIVRAFGISRSNVSRSHRKLREEGPGEFGKLIGLDRIPEVRCLRKKMDDLCQDDSAERWARHLSRYWMEKDPEGIGTLYIDGHVRVYHGHLTKLSVYSRI